MPADRRFDAAGVTLRYVDAGAGEPVVLAHCYAGDFDSQFVASGFFAALAADHRAIGMDMRGHGRSGKPHDPRQYGREMAWDIVRLIDHLQLTRAHVVGYSMGAHVVAQLLTLAPGRVVSATLGGAAGRRHWSAADDARVEREAAEMERGSLHSQIVRLWPRGRPAPTPAQVRERSARWLAGKDPLALAAVRRANRDQVITDAALAAADVPVQGVVGADDPYLVEFRQLAQAVPALELVVVDGAAHNTLASRPEFLQAVRRFVAAHPSVAASPAWPHPRTRPDADALPSGSGRGGGAGRTDGAYSNELILFGSLVLLASIVASAGSSRLGAPLPLVFLLIGMLIGEDGPGRVQFDDVHTAQLVGSMALAIIIFDGGLRTSKDTLRIAVRPAPIAGYGGRGADGGDRGRAASWLFDFDWLQALLIGAIIGSTDAAAVFGILHSSGVQLKQRVAATLEIESASNDPMAIFLTLSLIGILAPDLNRLFNA